MSSTATIHPDLVLSALLGTATRPTKLRNLELFHQICKERETLGSNDFSLRSIGEFVEARGGPKVKALWNVQSADYRKLIEAWQAYAGGPRLRELAKINSLDELSRSIEDPATRIVVERVLRERDMLRAEVNILKSQTKLTIDRRPNAARDNAGAPDGEMTLEIRPSPRLNQLEREALEHAVSPEHWKNEGWVEEKLGRVVKLLDGGRSRTIFKPGFTTAVRKLLA